MSEPRIILPAEGQLLGPSFPIAVACDRQRFRRAEFHVSGTPVPVGTYQPFAARHAARQDGPVTITALLHDSDGQRVDLPPVRATVRRDLYGKNARVSDRGRGFVFPPGRPGAIIGFNEAYTWPRMESLYRYGDPEPTEQYLRQLHYNGVNVLRMMLEYAQFREHLLENPLGAWNPRVVDFWDAFLPLCERYAVTVLLTPWDPFWMDRNWGDSPYNASNGGPCRVKRDWFTDPHARDAQKARLSFLNDRWAGSRAIFALDLFNEFDLWFDAAPEERVAWLEDMAGFVRGIEMERHGCLHMQTVSTASPLPDGMLADATFRHPSFEFANTHLYFPGSVNAPRDAVAPADAFAGGVRAALDAIEDGRPFTDSESGPIDLESPWLTNRPAFDTEVHHHMCWAHFAAGGCGPGMRWPYRIPHQLSDGMLANLRGVSQAAAAFEWHLFQPVNADARMHVDFPGVIVTGCSDDRQALAWLLHDTRGRPAAKVTDAKLTVKGLMGGSYLARTWNTATGDMLSARLALCKESKLTVSLPDFQSDMAVTLRPWAGADEDTARALRNAYGLDA